MRIAYLTANDPMDRRSWSGTQYYMARALERHCGEVYCVGPLPLLSARIGKAISYGLRKLGMEYLYTHTGSISRKLARLAEKKLGSAACDVIFAPAGSVVLANLRTNLPIVYLSDATFALMLGYYSEFSSLSASAVRVADGMERQAIGKSSRFVYPSSWAASSAISDYGADASKVHVIPFGANIDSWPERARAVAPRRDDVCRLLFIGREWERKGGQIAFETLKALEGAGVPAELSVVGCQPPDDIKHPRLRIIPFLNKNDSNDRTALENLFFGSHFCLLPTRAECFSIALCEANAYGLPIVSTVTGGLPELVREGVNGFLLPMAARGQEYASRIRDVFLDANGNDALRVSSRNEFESRLNWDSWARSMSTVLQAAVSGAA